MLKFLVFENGQPAEHWPVRNAYMIGADGSAMRGTMTYRDRMLVCDKREPGAAAIALQTPCGELGELTVQTCLLPDREEPYLLSLELARHRLMMLYKKSEDWGMFDIAADHPVARRFEMARRMFVEALCVRPDNQVKADSLAKDCLALAIDGSEELALAHAEMLLARRRASGAMPRRMFGAGVRVDLTDSRLRNGIQAHFDYIHLPTAWKAMVPNEGDYDLRPLKNWTDWARDHKVPVTAGPLVSFEPGQAPDWFYIWEHDYDTARDLIYEHVEQVVSSFTPGVDHWIAAAGLHVNKHFVVAYDQLMDLTRMTTLLVRKINPRARILIELQQPFGEYYATNQRSIPPLMYTDLLFQAAIQFDGLVLKLVMGQSGPGQYTRDLMQISDLIDQYAPFGKPVTIALAAPSAMVTEEMIAISEAGHRIDPNSGFWRRPWSPLVQAHWLIALLNVALSKPFVDSVIWTDVVDHPDIQLPQSGLITEDLQPKQSLRRMAQFRRTLATDGEASVLPGAL